MKLNKNSNTGFIVYLPHMTKTTLANYIQHRTFTLNKYIYRTIPRHYRPSFSCSPGLIRIISRTRRAQIKLTETVCSEQKVNPQSPDVPVCPQVVLETEITNKSALKLYENLGFVRDKRLFRYYLNGVDALRLKLWLR